MSEVVILVHGGAGRPSSESIAPAREAAMRDGIHDALGAGSDILESGGVAVDAVEEAVRRLEANPEFNAGRGSVLDAAGHVRMDASIMRGMDRAAGAVANLSRVVHPVSAARLVMERTKHVLLVANDALTFCEEQGLELEETSYFVTDLRREQLERAKRKERVALEHRHDDSLGTVGAVALDVEGDLAAATSTGGITHQLPGRVGDSAIIGAGTWSDNESCAVSATGTGEAIIRANFAHLVDALVRCEGLPLMEACQRAVEQVVSLGGSVGCIAVDKSGNVAMPFSTPMMARGVKRGGATAQVAIFGAM